MTTAVLDDLKRVYNRAWWALLLRALLALAVGVFIFTRPLDSVAAFALVIAWWHCSPVSSTLYTRSS